MTKHFPAIPEGCERFKIENGIAKFLDGNIWITVAKGLRSGSKSGTAANICNAARCAWLDEAERILLAQPRPVIAMYRYWDGLTYWESGILDPVRLQYLEWPSWEKDYAHCLAYAEAWAREAKE